MLLPRRPRQSCRVALRKSLNFIVRKNQNQAHPFADPTRLLENPVSEGIAPKNELPEVFPLQGVKLGSGAGI